MNKIVVRNMSVIVICLAIFSRCADYADVINYGDDNQNSEVSWDIGETNIHVISETGPTIITDQTTGYQFYFPDGGNGRLEVGKINSGPEAPLEGEMVYIDFDGEDPVQLMLPIESEKLNILSGYGQRPAVYDDEIADSERWLEIPPSDTLDGHETFDLYFGCNDDLGPVKSDGWDKLKWNGFKNHHITAIDHNTDIFSARVGMYNQMLEYMKKVLSELNPNAADVFRKKWYKSYKPDLIFSGNHYTGVIQLFYKQDILQPILSLKSDASHMNLAHELGHNVHHLLCSDSVFAGDEVFVRIFNAFPQPSYWDKEVHAFGDKDHAGISLLEDYAYFVQYFLTGQVGVVDLFEPSTLYRSLEDEKGPEDIDYPRREGFGAFLLGGIVRRNPQIVNFETFPDTKLDIPVMGTSFQEIFENIYPLGIVTINELREEVERFTGEPEKLQVIVQRYGWRYMARVKFIDKDGEPIKNREVEYFVRVGQKEYTEKGFMTNNEGEVELTKCFGGKGYVRIIIDNDTIDTQKEIPWEKPTNEAIDLGTIEVTEPIRLSEVIRVSASWIINATLSGSGAHIGYRGYGGGGDGSFNGEVFNFENSKNEYGVKILEKLFIRVDSVSKIIKEFRYLSSITDDWGGLRRDSICVSNIEYAYTIGDQITFLTSDTDFCNKIQCLDYKQIDACAHPPWSVELNGYSCDSNSHITINLFVN